MKEQLEAYFKEYDMLTAEIRLGLAASDPKLMIGFATCAALAGAGAWNHKYPLFLLVPLVVIFLALILAYQMEGLILLSAQLAVLEERINALLGDTPTLTYQSRTVVAVFDRPRQHNPITGRKRWSLTTIYNAMAMAILLSGSALAAWYGLKKLAADHPAAAKLYAVTVIVGALASVYLLWRATKSKRWYLDLIRDNLKAHGIDSAPAPGGEGPPGVPDPSVKREGA